LKEIRDIRQETSKKDPAIRRQELVKAASQTLLEFIAAKAEALMGTSFGCQFIVEVLFDADGDKSSALNAVAAAAKSKPEAKESAHVGRMLKLLVQGGRFNNKEKTIEKVDPPLKFDAILYGQIQDEIMSWAAGSNPFVVVALTESDDFDKKNDLLKTLKKNRKALEKAASTTSVGEDGKKKASPTSSGAKILLEKLQ
jgi:pumilio family protein 6